MCKHTPEVRILSIVRYNTILGDIINVLCREIANVLQDAATFGLVALGGFSGFIVILQCDPSAGSDTEA